MELFKNCNYDFLAKKRIFIGASIALAVAGLVSLAAKGGPRYGIDFQGGAVMEVAWARPFPVETLRAALSPKLPGVTVVRAHSLGGSEETIIGADIRDDRELAGVRQTMTETLARLCGPGGGKLDVNNASREALAERLRAVLPDGQAAAVSDAIVRYRDTPPRSGLIRRLDELAGAPGVPAAVLPAIQRQLAAGPYSIRNFEVVGPQIGAGLRRQAVMATAAASAGMLLYLAWRFELAYGVAAVAAVLHDTLVTVGLFSLTDMEISMTVVAALLTLIGYSMNDTIVVFDRVRENRRALPRLPLADIVNLSINQTLSRTVLTSGLTLLTALSLLLFGGPVLRGFSFALVAGIVVGTYSSIFIASPILVGWERLRSRKNVTAREVLHER